MPLDQCPCPKGDGAWLEYRRLWVEQRRLVDELRATNDLLGKEAARHEAENRALRASPPGATLVDVVGADQVQIVILALAELQLRRPGWNHAINDIVTKCGGAPAAELLKQFMRSSADGIKSFSNLRDELWDWVNGTGGMGPAYPSTTEAGKVVREIADRLDEAILPMEAKFRGG